jgi:hypothetical protein
MEDADENGSTNRAWGGGDTLSAVVELGPGAQTLPTDDKALTEHVTAGQFEVTSVHMESQSFVQSEIKYSGVVTVYQVRQVALLDPSFPGEVIEK